MRAARGSRPGGTADSQSPDSTAAANTQRQRPPAHVGFVRRMMLCSPSSLQVTANSSCPRAEGGRERETRTRPVGHIVPGSAQADGYWGYVRTIDGDYLGWSADVAPACPASDLSPTPGPWVIGLTRATTSNQFRYRRTPAFRRPIRRFILWIRLVRRSFAAAYRDRSSPSTRRPRLGARLRYRASGGSLWIADPRVVALPVHCDHRCGGLTFAAPSAWAGDGLHRRPVSLKPLLGCGPGNP